MIIHLLNPAHVLGDLVRLSTSIGTGAGRWKGHAPQPAQTDVDVELDTDELIPWDRVEVSREQQL